MVGALAKANVNIKAIAQVRAAGCWRAAARLGLWWAAGGAACSRRAATCASASGPLRQQLLVTAWLACSTTCATYNLSGAPSSPSPTTTHARSHLSHSPKLTPTHPTPPGPAKNTGLLRVQHHRAHRPGRQRARPASGAQPLLPLAGENPPSHSPLSPSSASASASACAGLSPLLCGSCGMPRSAQNSRPGQARPGAQGAASRCKAERPTLTLPAHPPACPPRCPLAWAL
jgi:hypothetical protein